LQILSIKFFYKKFHSVGQERLGLHFYTMGLFVHTGAGEYNEFDRLKTNANSIRGRRHSIFVNASTSTGAGSWPKLILLSCPFYFDFAFFKHFGMKNV
jgi:hypothetical protein